MDGDCGYCYQAILNQDYLECIECEQYVHVKCLKRPGTPGDFSGDVFFEFKCTNCTVNGIETFVRQRLPWAVIIALSIHNLSINSTGLSHHGYYHWRTHIVYFIDKNWTHIMGPNVKRRKKWIGTISGTLSHNSPTLFESGSNVFNEPGWWRLTHNVTPMKFFELFKRFRREKSGPDEVNIDDGTSLPAPQSKPFKRSRESSDDDFEHDPPVFSRTLPYMGCIPHTREAIVKSEPPLDLFDFMETDKFDDLLDNMELEPTKMDAGLIPSYQNSLHGRDWTDNLVDYVFGNDNIPEAPPQALGDADDNARDVNDFDGFHGLNLDEHNYSEDFRTQTGSSEEAEQSEESVQRSGCEEPTAATSLTTTAAAATTTTTKAAKPMQPLETMPIRETIENTNDNSDHDEDVPYEIKYQCERSLFNKRTAASANPPWELEDAIADGPITLADQCSDVFTGDKNIELMSEYEENEAYKRLKAILMTADTTGKIIVPTSIRRFYRKLCVRRTKRSLGKPVFDIDNYNRVRFGKAAAGATSILDRFNQQLITSSGRPQGGSLHARLSGACHHDMFISPHTGRILHPFIYRSEQCVPPWVKLMCELQYVVNDRMPSRASIDYCYVRPQHIAAVNALLQRLFWPGIDMSECLSYPDFSIVALYKKLVVGCAFLVPDVGHNEAYVSFMAVRPGWQRAGIAKFMLYHLTQTCFGKDITLHVSASNPAICLYQKFGFKIEELILDFYDKFLPIDSTQSRHAFLLRMER